MDNIELISKIINDLQELKIQIINQDINKLANKRMLFEKWDYLELSARSRNVLKQLNDHYNVYLSKYMEEPLYPHLKFLYVGELVQLNEEDILGIPGCGRKSLNEIKESLKEHGLSFGMCIPGLTNENIEKVREAKGIR